MNGEIRQIYNKQTNKGIGVERVWLKKHDFPGLAMSRSLGDKLAHTVGVIPEPDLKTVKLDRDMNEYLVMLASDGVWDQYTPEQIREQFIFPFSIKMKQEEI